MIFELFRQLTTDLAGDIMAEPWLPWLYQYGVGGAFFFITIALVLRSGALPLSVRANRLVLAALVFGYFALATIHGLWIAVLT